MDSRPFRSPVLTSITVRVNADTLKFLKQKTGKTTTELVNSTLESLYDHHLEQEYPQIPNALESILESPDSRNA
jgi:hypothetical protein